MRENIAIHSPGESRYRFMGEENSRRPAKLQLQQVLINFITEHEKMAPNRKWCASSKKVKVKVRVYSLESSRNLSPDFTIISFADHWKRPHSYKLSFLDYGIHKEHVSVRSRFPLSSPLTLGVRRLMWNPISKFHRNFEN